MNIYTCYDTGKIECDPYYTDKVQFAIVRNFDSLYIEELPRFIKYDFHAYAMPKYDTPVNRYLGLDRIGPPSFKYFETGIGKAEKIICNANKLTDDDLDDYMSVESNAIKFFSHLQNSKDYDLICSRILGCKAEIPPTYKFVGYDITYMPSYHGSFSIINDCMFICKWHGCDEEGSLFIPYFEKLNQNGLFDDPQIALDYMTLYLNCDWSERGEYFITEIYLKDRNEL